MMQGQNVRNELRDEKNNVVYIVMAYRALTRSEMMRSSQELLSKLPQRQRSPKNKTFTIMTTFGIRGKSAF
jgi:hypothetical protein